MKHYTFTHLVLQLITAVLLLTPGQCSSKHQPSCGVKSGDDPKRYMVGCGEENDMAKTEGDLYPWLVAIVGQNSNVENSCLGVVISRYDIITSAFCAEAYNKAAKELRRFEFSNYLVLYSSDVEKVIIHNNYRRSNLENNIAIVKFSKKINVRPICIWNLYAKRDHSIFRNPASVPAKFGSESTIHDASFRILKRKTCRSLMPSKYHKYFINESLCTVDATSSETELGDAKCISGFGAPMQFKMQGQWYLRGLYNRGFPSINQNVPCAHNHVISFTDVANYDVDFIFPNAPTIESIELSIDGQADSIVFHPWFAALYKNDDGVLKLTCGASLISETFLLTAAHCFDNVNKNDVVVILGNTLYLETALTEDDFGVQSKYIKNVSIHKDYDKKTVKNDIAIIELQSPVSFSDQVSPICISSKIIPKETLFGGAATVIGMGYTTVENHPPAELQKIDLPILNDEICKESNSYFKKIDDKRICAGYFNENTAPCLGDSGSPLTLRAYGYGVPAFLIGIVSEAIALKGSNGTKCDANYPTIYTNVLEYYEWIVNITGKTLPMPHTIEQSGPKQSDEYDDYDENTSLTPYDEDTESIMGTTENYMGSTGNKSETTQSNILLCIVFMMLACYYRVVLGY